MTKENFEKYEGMLHCKTCGHDVPKLHISYNKVYTNGDIARCNVCEWIKRHNGIPNVEGFSESDIELALYFIIYEKSSYLNDLADMLQCDIYEAIRLFRALKIGNKKAWVKSNCECCGKEIKIGNTKPSKYCKKCKEIIGREAKLKSYHKNKNK